MPKRLKLPQHILDANPEAAELLKRKPARLVAERPRDQTDQAPLFAYAWRVIAPHCPAPTGEYHFTDTRAWRFDWAWPLYRVAVEVDGGQHQAGGGQHGSDADRDKLNHAAALGWRVLHFSPAQLTEDPAGCCALVERALAYYQGDDQPRARLTW